MMSALVRGMLFTVRHTVRARRRMRGKADGRGSAGHGGDEGGQDGHQQRGLECIQHGPVLEQLQYTSPG